MTPSSAAIIDHTLVGKIMTVGDQVFLKVSQPRASRGLVLIRPQAYGSIVAFQGRSHRDWVKLLGYNPSRYAK